jgi:hypothetical protein
MPKLTSMVGFPLLLVVLATAALAQGTTENPTLSPTGMTSTGDQASIGLTISTKADQTLVLRQAALVDKGKPLGLRLAQLH